MTSDFYEDMTRQSDAIVLTVRAASAIVRWLRQCIGLGGKVLMV